MIYYHDVGTRYTDMGTSFDVIREHIMIAKSSLFEIVPEINSEKDQLMICFDDGWRGIYDYKDLFVTQGVFPIVFVAVELIGTEGHLSLKEINELRELGFIFQAHGWSHIDLTTVHEKHLKVELFDSKRRLEELLNHSVDSVCFPLGRFSEEVLFECQEAGYKKMYSSIWGSYNEMSRFSIVCRCFCQDLDTKEFKHAILGDSIILRMNLKRRHFVYGDNRSN